MSDPVTNVEIEDVLSSIRRLVSDGDKARTRDPAPEHVHAAPPIDTSETASESILQTPNSDRLVLTPAFLVPDAETDTVAETDAPDADEADNEAWEEESWPEAEPADAKSDADDSTAQDPLPLTEMVFEDVDDETSPADIAQVPTDRAGLVATIAELEAAISAGDDEFEPDGSEVVAGTIAWPGTVVRAANSFADAEISDETVEDAVEVLEAEGSLKALETVQPEDTLAEDDSDDENIMPSFEHRSDEAVPERGAEPADAFDDDDLDGLLDAGAAGMSTDALRALVAEVVREELAGPMGERITRNVRKLVRREIYRILSSQEFD